MDFQILNLVIGKRRSLTGNEISNYLRNQGPRDFTITMEFISANSSL